VLRNWRIFATVAATTAALAAGPTNAWSADLLSGSVSIVNETIIPPGGPVISGAGSGPTTSPVGLAGYSFTFTGDTITYTNPYGAPYASYPAGGFNGFILTFTGVPNISGVTNDPSSELDPTAISFTSDSIDIAFNGLPRYYGEQSVFDVTFAGGVPEPAGWMTLLVGFGLVGAGLRLARTQARGPLLC